jgi:hypothetical protein
VAGVSAAVVAAIVVWDARGRCGGLAAGRSGSSLRRRRGRTAGRTPVLGVAGLGRAARTAGGLPRTRRRRRGRVGGGGRQWCRRGRRRPVRRRIRRPRWSHNPGAVGEPEPAGDDGRRRRHPESPDACVRAGCGRASVHTGAGDGCQPRHEGLVDLSLGHVHPQRTGDLVATPARSHWTIMTRPQSIAPGEAASGEAA